MPSVQGFKVWRRHDRSRKKYADAKKAVLSGFAGAPAADQLWLAQQALAQMRESVVITDTEINEPGPTIVYVNEAFTRMTGYLPEEVIGKNPRILQGPKTSRRTLDRLRAALEKGEGFEGEDINYRKDGSEFQIDWYIEPLRDESGAIKYFVAVQRDVTARRILEGQLLQAQRLEGIGLLASGIAHDLNNVLAPIILGSDLLHRSSADPETSQFITILEESAGRGAALVEQILAFARGITDARNLVQPRQILCEVEKLARTTFPKSIRIRADTPDETWSVDADPTQLYQILLNLCINARNAIGESGAITLTARNADLTEPKKIAHGELAAGKYVVLAVTDTRSGMSPETVAKIFDPFFTTKDFGKGLGLSTIALILKNYRGGIEITTAPDQGTTFSIYLPALAGESALKEKFVKTIPRDGGGASVLIADDEAAITEIMKETLTQAGYKIATAATTTEALERAVEMRPNVALINLMMQGAQDGIRELRSRDPRLPVIVISSLSIGEIKNIVPEANAILQKPFTLENLLVAVHNALTPKVPVSS